MLAISSATGTSANDVVNGMYHIQSGLHLGAAGLGVLQAAAEGAKVGNADLDTVSKTLTGTMASYYGAHINASNATKLANTTMNQLIATVGAGDMKMQDLASSLGNVTPAASQAGLSFAQVGGAIATMTSQNMSAQQATQDLNNLIANLQKPNAVAANEMAQLGLNANDVSKNLGKKGLTGTLGELTSAITSHMGPAGMVLQNAFNQSQGAAADMTTELSKMPPAARKVAQEFAAGHLTVQQYRTAVKAMPADQQAMLNGFISTYDQAHKFNQMLTSGSPAAQTFNSALEKVTGGQTGLNTALMLTGNNMPIFQQNVDTVAKAAKDGGNTVDNWNTIQKTFNQQVDQAKTTVENLGISLGLSLIPKLEDAAHAGMDVVEWLEHHKTAGEALAVTITSVLGVAVAAFTVNKLANMVKGVAQAAKTLADLGKSATTLAGKLLGLQDTSSKAGTAASGALNKVQTAGSAAEGDLSAAGTRAAASIKGGAEAAATDLEAAGATAEADLAAGGATAKSELAAGGTAGEAGGLAGLGAPLAGDAASAGAGLAVGGGALGLAGAALGATLWLQTQNNPNAQSTLLPPGITPSQAAKGGAAAANLKALGGNLSFLSQIPHRALGGQVYAGQPFVGDELGPEMFLPNVSGTVIPNSATGGALSALASQGTTYAIGTLQVVSQNPRPDGTAVEAEGPGIRPSWRITKKPLNAQHPRPEAGGAKDGGSGGSLGSTGP